MPTSSLVTSTYSVAQLVNSLDKLPVGCSTQPSLYVDCRGNDISILGLFVYPQNHIYLVDIEALGERAFTVRGKGGITLRDILQSATVPKVFYTVYFPSLPLYARFGITLQGVQDMQIMQWASRPGPLSYPIFKQHLGTAIKRDAQIPPEEKQSARACYKAAARLFDLRKGGSVQVFGIRPLAEEIWAYFVHTFQYLPHLHEIYWDRVVMLRREQLVANMTQGRLQLCRDPKNHGRVNEHRDNQYGERPQNSLISLQGPQISPTSKINYWPSRLVRRIIAPPRNFRKVIRR